MAEQSRIGWTRSTFNPVIGCTKVGPGCDHCYASVSTPARSLGIKWGPGELRHRTSAANWRQPLRWNEQARKTGEFWPVFCASLADVFDYEWPDGVRADLFELIEATPALTWLVLTKRIGNARGMQPYRWQGVWPANIWLGATIVNQKEADRDIPKLLATPAAKRFVSYEPALGPVDFGLMCENWSDDIVMDPETGDRPCCRKCDYTGIGNNIDWIIVGGESDQQAMKARPFDIDWARSTVQQCKAAGVPVFVKQLGSHAGWDGTGAPPACECKDHASIAGLPHWKWRLNMNDRAGADPAEWPEDLRVQEWPK